MNKFCTNCGKEIAEGNKFCVSCGTPLNNVSQGCSQKTEEIKADKTSTKAVSSPPPIKKEGATKNTKSPTPKQWGQGCLTFIIIAGIIGGCMSTCKTKNEDKANNKIVDSQKSETCIQKEDEGKRKWRDKIDKWEKKYYTIGQQIDYLGGTIPLVISKVNFSDVPPSTYNDPSKRPKAGKTFLTFRIVAYNRNEKASFVAIQLYNHNKDKYGLRYAGLTKDFFPPTLKPLQKTEGTCFLEVDKNEKYSIALFEGQNNLIHMIKIN